MAELQVPVRVEDHARGTLQASVMLVMYGDYECPYTRRAYRVVQRLLNDVPGELYFVYRHFPLIRIHPHAEHAAEASEVSAAQSMFWEMHDALFAHEDADVRRYAADLALDTERFANDLETRAFAPRIAVDVRSGLASEVQGTPMLDFNGRLHAGGYDEATLRATIARLGG
ncbi:MAG TPA: thioredoxin domain-containing protein [Ktedonobacterales bacterium]